VKTRLIPALGAEGAAKLAAQMLEQTVAEALASGLQVELCGEPDPASWYDGAPVHLTTQGEGGLGERLHRAAERALATENILLIGADCPALNAPRLRAAAEELARHDAVIHPAEDGGYVLLGLRRFAASLFEGIAWSTNTVAAETQARIDALGWTTDVRETLADVDEPSDLLRHPRESGGPASSSPSGGRPPQEEKAGFPLSRE
jgi:hypothetical protein